MIRFYAKTSHNTGVSVGPIGACFMFLGYMVMLPFWILFKILEQLAKPRRTNGPGG